VLSALLETVRAAARWRWPRGPRPARAAFKARSGVRVRRHRLLVIPNPLVQRLQALSVTDPFAYTRISVWKGALSMMLDHPWLGIGLGQYEYVSTRYAFAIPTHWAKHSRVAENAHSEYLQAGAEMGLPGLLLALGALALAVLAVVRRLRQLPRSSWGPVATLGSAAVSIAAQSAVDFPLHGPPAALARAAGSGLRCTAPGGLPSRFASARVRRRRQARRCCWRGGRRPVLGFWHFLGGSALRETCCEWAWSSAAPPRPTPGSAAPQPGLPSTSSAPSPRARQSSVQGTSPAKAADAQQALYHLNYAADSTPTSTSTRQPRQATTLARREPPGQGGARHFGTPPNWRLQLPSTRIGLLDELGDLEGAKVAFRRAVAMKSTTCAGGSISAPSTRAGRPSGAQAFSRNALAEGAGLVPTHPRRNCLLPNRLFHNELKKIRAHEHQGGRSS
jgi:hypothetical protein